MSLNTAEFQGYSFYRFWVIKGKPTRRRAVYPLLALTFLYGKVFISSQEIKMNLSSSFVIVVVAYCPLSINSDTVLGENDSRCSSNLVTESNLLLKLRHQSVQWTKIVHLKSQNVWNISCVYNGKILANFAPQRKAEGKWRVDLFSNFNETSLTQLDHYEILMLVNGKFQTVIARTDSIWHRKILAWNR